MTLLMVHKAFTYAYYSGKNKSWVARLSKIPLACSCICYHDYKDFINSYNESFTNNAKTGILEN